MSGSRTEAEPGVILVVFGAILLIAGWFVWHQFRGPILEVLRWLRYGEFWIIHLLTGKDAACVNWLRYVQVNTNNPPAEIVGYAQECFGTAYLASLPGNDAFDHYRLTGYSMGDLARIITWYDRWLLAAASASVGMYIIYFSPRGKFKTRHTLESFINVQAKMWPIINPIVKFNPTKFSARKLGDKMPDKIPPMAEAFSPEEWISWHRIPVVNNIPDREAVRRALLLQFGPRWNGIEGTPKHVQVLFAAFALKGRAAP